MIHPVPDPDNSPCSRPGQKLVSVTKEGLELPEDEDEKNDRAVKDLVMMLLFEAW